MGFWGFGVLGFWGFGAVPTEDEMELTNNRARGQADPE